MMLAMLLVGCMAAVGCKEDKITDKLDMSAPAPAPLTLGDMSHKDYTGYSVIRYKLPNDENLSYVKAEYETAPGVKREAKASRFVDSLVVEGFGKAGTYSVQLSTVGLNEKTSEAVTYSVSPSTPPLESSWTTFGLEEAFGGVYGHFVDSTNAPLTVVLSADTTKTKNFIQLRAYTLKNTFSTFAYLSEALDTFETKFSVYMKDRFGNRTDSREFNLKPMFQEDIPKPWEKIVLDGDWTEPAEGNANYKFENMWDGVSNQERNNIFAASHSGPSFPYTLTIGLKTRAVLSQIRIHHRVNFAFAAKALKIFELYGSDKDNPTVSDDDWMLLGQFTSTIPSGNATPNDEDKAYAITEGELFMILPSEIVPDPYKPVKFIRLKIQGVWDGSIGGQIIIGEIDLMGRIVK